MPTLIDATVLSNLACAGRLSLVSVLSDTCYLASAVYEETRQGVEEGYVFLDEVDGAIDAGFLQLTTLEDEEEWRLYREMPDKLHRGEGMSLAIALHRGWRFLTDDRAARLYARRLGVSYSGTLGLLRYAVQRGSVTLEEGNALLLTMINCARFRSPVTDLRYLDEENPD
jgi:predicted nucleic acid-binding protein